MPLQQTSGAASYDAFGGGVPVAAKYIEDFFQTWLRTGTGSSTTVTTGLNASINKSLVWTKSRSAATNHKLTDTARGVTKALSSNTTGAEVTDSQGLTAFSSTGYTIGTNTDYNNSGATYVDWQWVATPKFFDVVTWTGSTGNRTLSHALNSVPGMIILKKTSGTGDWYSYHRSLGNATAIALNSSDAAISPVSFWQSTTPTDTQFFVNSDWNDPGQTYVAYLFAHNAGGFGLTGTDNVISCGSYVGNGSTSGPVVTLGYEPQYVLIKAAGNMSNWIQMDNMRAWGVDGGSFLYANLSNAESSVVTASASVNATGFTLTRGDTNTANAANLNLNGVTYIYIAIRRGPMRTPTTGTSVFSPIAYTGNGTSYTISGLSNTPDLLMGGRRTGTTFLSFVDRLRGFKQSLFPYGTGAEATSASTEDVISMNNNNVVLGTVNNTTFNAAVTDIAWIASRAPGFFDEVCTTLSGASGNERVTHNLGVAPELIIMKARATTNNWYAYNAPQGRDFWLQPNTTTASQSNTNTWGTSNPTATDFGVASNFFYGASRTVVCYLFASCPGVSKVFSYTGNGSSQTINCGFTGGARFVMIKRTDSTGDWYVWDTARGIVANNDPHLSLNTTAAEVTTNDTIDTDSTGFVVNQVSATNVNVNGASYIGLAIA